jgi:hypothetical protein
MKHVEEAAVGPEITQPEVPGNGPAALPPLPSEDQKFFNESLMEGVRSMGALIRSRKKPK